MRNRTETILFVLLMLVLLPIEWLCAQLAFRTLGATWSMLYELAVIGLNLVVILVATRSRAAAAGLALIIALLVIPYQLVLGDRLLRVQTEAAAIVTHVYEHQVEHGAFPADLTGYGYADPPMARFIIDYTRSDTQGGFFLRYRVGTANTSYMYSPAYGWRYASD